MKEQEAREFISDKILGQMADQSKANILRDILFDKANKIDWSKAAKSIIENNPQFNKKR